MKRSNFTKSFFLFCVMFFLGVSSIQAQTEYAPPTDSITGGSWTVLNWDVTKTNNWAEFPMMHAVWSSSTYSNSAISPTDATNKTFRWSKSGTWGGIKLYTSNINKYIDFTKWDSLKIDVYIATANLTEFQINFLKHGANEYSTASVNSGKWYSFSNKPMAQWNTVTMPISAINYPTSTNNLATSFCGVVFNINPNASGPYDVYIDNFRLVKTNPGGTTSVVNPTTNNLKVIVNAATEEIVLIGAKGNVSIYNTLGAEVISLNNYQGATISTSKLAKGAYLVKTTTGSQKFIKK